MKKYKKNLWLILFPLLVSIGCSTHSELKNYTNIAIPPEFKIIDHDSSLEHILAVEYKDEMLIIVSKSMSNTIKKSALFGPGIMKYSFEIKFPILVEKHGGTNVSEQNHSKVNGNIYLHRSFDYEMDSTSGYFEYIALHIEKPEEYFELMISGEKSQQENHRSLIDSFLKGVK